MANENFVNRYRKYGEEQPYWKAGIFKIRLPFIHYAWSIPEMVQALFIASAAPVGANVAIFAQQCAQG